MFVDLEFDENGTDIQSSNGNKNPIVGYSRANSNAPDFYQLNFEDDVIWIFKVETYSIKFLGQ